MLTIIYQQCWLIEELLQTNVNYVALFILERLKILIICFLIARYSNKCRKIFCWLWVVLCLKNKKGSKVCHLIWLAITLCFWRLCYKIVFRGAMPNVSSMIDQITFISWFWFLGRSGSYTLYTFVDRCNNYFLLLIIQILLINFLLTTPCESWCWYKILLFLVKYGSIENEYISNSRDLRFQRGISLLQWDRIVLSVEIRVK
jgi:hypothetical protein